MVVMPCDVTSFSAWVSTFVGACGVGGGGCNGKQRGLHATDCSVMLSQLVMMHYRHLQDEY